MKSILNIIILEFFILFFFSCNEKQKNKKDKNIPIIATIDSIIIYQNEVEYFVKQKLYDELSRIHLIRKIALEEIIKNKLLEREADKQSITKNELLQKLYNSKINEKSILNFAKRREYDVNGINAIEKNIVNYQISSKKGLELIRKNFESFILSNYIDSIKQKSDLSIYLKPPTPPKVKIDQSLVHFYGNKKSKVKFIEISDFECDMCRKYSPIFKKLYNKYKNDVAFGYINYGSYVSKQAIASEAAGKQGKFQEMKELLFKDGNYNDNKEIELLALKLNLDIERFRKDFNDPDLISKLEENYNLFHKSGIYGTPTILINYRIMHNSSSIEELESFLTKKIEESKK
jgi:protein-disulfide isomerase